MLAALLFAATAHATPYDDGVAALVARKPDAAVAAFGRCIAETPDDVRCRWELGWAHVLRRDWDAVIATWEDVLRRQPDHPQAADELAIAREQLRVRDEARAALARAKAAPPYRSRAPANATLRLRAVGDLMIGTAFPEGALPPDDAAGAFEGVAPALRDADLTLGNLEGPLCDTEAVSRKCRANAAPGSCYVFRSPTRYAPLYKDAGFDVLTVANNHANDFGPACRDQTRVAITAQGIALTGRPGSIARKTVNGLRVSVLGFHTSDTGYNLNDTDIAAALVAGEALENDLVVVTFHGGAEGANAQHVPSAREFFKGEDRGDVRAFARAMVDAGADLIVGHGPHVLRGMESYKGRFIAYSLGNFATYGRFNLSGPQGIAGILDVTLTRDGTWTAARMLPTVQLGEGLVTLDAEARALPLLRDLSAQDLGADAIRVADDGRLLPPCPTRGAACP